MEYVKVRFKKNHPQAGEERVLTRTAAYLLRSKVEIIEENVEAPSAEGTSSPNVGEKSPAEGVVTGSGGDEILIGLRNQYKELTGQDADTAWSEEVLMTKIGEALSAGSSEGKEDANG